MKNNEAKKRKSSFNPNRACYLSADGKYYCYDVMNPETRRVVTQKYEVGKDLTIDITLVLDELDHDMDLNDRYQKELRDPLFDTKAAKHDADVADDGVADPWETLADKSGGPEDILFAAPELENPQAAAVRRVIDEECTDAQRDFFFAHFGERKQLEEMRQAEAERTGKLSSPSAMNNRKNKIIDKAAKTLGVERVKRHKSPPKG